MKNIQNCFRIKFGFANALVQVNGCLFFRFIFNITLTTCQYIGNNQWLTSNFHIPTSLPLSKNHIRDINRYLSLKIFLENKCFHIGFEYNKNVKMRNSVKITIKA